MSAERYLDLMECCKLDMERLEAEQGKPALSPREHQRTANLRALVVVADRDLRAILWPSGAIQVIQSRYLLPAKLTE